MKTFAAIMLGLALCASVLAEKKPKRPDHVARLSLTVHQCPGGGAACKTFKQLVQAKDKDVLAASWACFYAGHNPAESTGGFEGSSTPSADEFFLLMDGTADVTQSGVHPGIFVNRIQDGVPDGYGGYGPEHGGLGEFNTDGKEAMVRTYDDLGDNIRWAEFRFNTGPNDPKGVYRALVVYEETLMRKSTGRFTQKTTEFTGPLETRGYAGKCFQLK